ncbi:sigma-70 family RNA polymerase sigma factor [Herbaspirillum sp. AP02]|uniref:sigma-70 family RNA polymerase sigma factor n=1 Tax=unclassified Herbaspirillum TaxID=2624150 RepID=UPI0015DB0A10|nr:sigma-70 family RNA polymerase sigma factor [Herbaspirillum sp. AP02]NZD66757.1 sigma-70 family RNA polymerase sigma factor [Herbaspirillum sp. AP21]
MTDAPAFDHEAALLACAAGERGALQRLYQQEGRYLLGVALRIVRDRALAEDVLHDAFLNIWTRAASFDPARGAARGWIFTVVRHTALNRLRALQHEVNAGDDLEALADHHEPAVQAPEWQADLGRLEDCLGQLSDAKRASIVYAYVDGCTHSEIAERLKAPLGSVKAWIKRGLAALRECIG